MAVVGMLVGPGLTWASSPGTSGAAVLNIPVGARAIAMGEAYTALADDASSLYWNPAGLAYLNQSQASFMHNPFAQDLMYENASVAVPLENGALGASLSYLSYGNIDGFDAAGNPTEQVNAYSGVATLGGALLGDFWAAGFNIKGVQESLADVKATGIAADVGATLLYPREVKGATLRAGAAVRNLGSGLKLIDQNDPFPRQWRVGVAALELVNRKLNVSMDYGQERNSSGAFYLGSEYWFIPLIAVRAGYAGSDVEGNGIRAGIGLKFKNVSFDYAYSRYGDLGFSHRYELSMRFGAIHPRLSPEERRLLRQAKVAMANQRYGEATQLFDALIQMEPNYRPIRRLVKVSMAGYEKQERSSSAPFKSLQASGKILHTNEVDELKDLEALLNASDEAMAAASRKSLQERKP